MLCKETISFLFENHANSTDMNCKRNLSHLVRHINLQKLLTLFLPGNTDRQIACTAVADFFILK